MRRRDLVLAAGLTVVGGRTALKAQPRSPRLIYLWFGPRGSDGSTRDGLQAGLREVGYHEGTDIVVDYRYANGESERLEALAQEIVAENPDLILSPGTIGTEVFKRLTTSIPIVSTTPDPVGSGFVSSLAHPGGNITGATIAAGPEIAEKWLELITELVPSAARIALLYNPGNSASAAYLERMRAIAMTLTPPIGLTEYKIRASADFPAAFSVIAADHPDAFIPDTDVLTVSSRAAVVAFAATAQLPTLYGLRDFVDAGGLISYGASIFEVWRRAAVYIDRILKGAKPFNLPVEQPTRFELVINLKVAKSLSLTVPRSLLARADEVIE